MLKLEKNDEELKLKDDSLKQELKRKNSISYLTYYGTLTVVSSLLLIEGIHGYDNYDTYSTIAQLFNEMVVGSGSLLTGINSVGFLMELKDTIKDKFSKKETEEIKQVIK